MVMDIIGERTEVAVCIVQHIQTQLTDDLDAVSQWLNVNRLTLNTTKTQTILFGTQQNLLKVKGGGGLKLKMGGISRTDQLLQVPGRFV